jgi:hypothetical protein
MHEMNLFLSDCGFLGCSGMQFHTVVPMLRRTYRLLLEGTARNTEAAASIETVALIYRITRRRRAESIILAVRTPHLIPHVIITPLIACLN